MSDGSALGNNFWINCESEYGRGNTFLGGGSVDTDAIAERAKKKWSHLSKEERDQTFEEIIMERAKAQLTKEEFDLFQIHYKIAGLRTGLFRINAGIKENKPYLHLTFEGYLFTDEEGKADRGKFYSYVEDELRRRRKLTVTDHVLMSGAHSEHSQVQRDDGPMKDVYGKNHGRPYEQVCFDVELYDLRMSRNDVAVLMKEISCELDERDLGKDTVNVS